MYFLRYRINSNVETTDSPTRDGTPSFTEEEEEVTTEMESHGPSQQGGGDTVHRPSSKDRSEREEEKYPVWEDDLDLPRGFFSRGPPGPL